MPQLSTTFARLAAVEGTIPCGRTDDAGIGRGPIVCGGENAVLIVIVGRGQAEAPEIDRHAQLRPRDALIPSSLR